MKIVAIDDYDEKKIPEEAIALSGEQEYSEEEIVLAYELAKRAYERGYNIAKKFKFEFLLWLTGKTDIKSALRITEPKNGKRALVVVFGDEKIANAKKARIKKTAEPLDLERIALSRIK